MYIIIFVACLTFYKKWEKMSDNLFLMLGLELSLNTSSLLMFMCLDFFLLDTVLIPLVYIPGFLLMKFMFNTILSYGGGLRIKIITSF